MKPTFKNKLFFKISIIFTCFIVILSIIFFGYAYKMLRSDSVKNLNYVSQRTADEINNLITSMDSLALNISTNHQVRDFYTAAVATDLDNAELSNQINDVLISAMIPKSVSKFRISLYNRKGNFISTGLAYNQNITSKLLNSDDYLSWYNSKGILGQNGPLLDVTKDFWSTSASTTITLYRNIYPSSYTSQSCGIVEIQCPIDYITEFMSTTENHYYYKLNDQNGKKIYCSDLTYKATKQNSILTSVVLDSGWALTSACPKIYAFRLLLPLLFYTFMIYFTMIGICLLIINRILQNITKPLTILTDKVHNITVHQPALGISFSGYPDEFEQLNEAFADMMERLQLYMEENIKRKAYEMQANMIALQSQMNPHFIYNILTVIKSHALEENYEQIGPACNYLAQMLRYISVYSEESVPLSSELNHAILYLKLMKIRYEDNFSYSIQNEESLDSSKIFLPRLCIQPLLENCFQHGFKKVLPVWEININCYQDETLFIIEISDNGIGFLQKDIDNLREKVDSFLKEPSASLPSLTLGGMGLINTLVRMKLKYHENFQYFIKPSDTFLHGTKIVFQIGGIKL
ncbi:histidine kinase [Anaerocolumna sp. AGMB13025]|uniref:sensor histidine kinase n=1 Tax=Anaerocolumna sp. AGMB13025 TaxID=3039116 RepID=UPI00241D832D|nr:histidine kinase [Anaerocolumna sp. AGMB13025]WFR57296.1 histidine kinase [Anaerocolumna sp. AGMB13025]